MDTFTKNDRSDIMRKVKSCDTRPELAVRSLLHSMGYRFRLHRRALPGTPDIVLPKYKTVVFVHGCFWHRHRDCKRATSPASHREYWLPKFNKTKQRDRKNQEALRELGWQVVVVWECQVKDTAALACRLNREILRTTLYKPPSHQPAEIAAENSIDYGAEKTKCRTNG